MNTRRKEAHSSLDDMVCHFNENKAEYEVFLEESYTKKHICLHKG